MDHQASTIRQKIDREKIRRLKEIFDKTNQTN